MYLLGSSYRYALGGRLLARRLVCYETNVWVVGKM